MPHSISPELSVPQDSILPDAPLHGLNEEVADASDDDSDKSAFSANNSPENEKNPANIKIEELFGSDDEEDEFLSSSAESASKINGDTSPAPQMY